jgi:hypothetical protein
VRTSSLLAEAGAVEALEVRVQTLMRALNTERGLAQQLARARDKAEAERRW